MRACVTEPGSVPANRVHARVTRPQTHIFVHGSEATSLRPSGAPTKIAVRPSSKTICLCRRAAVYGPPGTSAHAAVCCSSAPIRQRHRSGSALAAVSCQRNSRPIQQKRRCAARRPTKRRAAAKTALKRQRSHRARRRNEEVPTFRGRRPAQGPADETLGHLRPAPHPERPRKI